MRLEVQKYLYDIQQAAGLIAQFSSGKTFDDYSQDAMLRSAIERQFEIIGEALSQLAKKNPGVVSQISEYQRVIAFRNILIHGYTQVDDRVVWSLMEAKLPLLRQQINTLLGSKGHLV